MGIIRLIPTLDVDSLTKLWLLERIAGQAELDHLSEVPFTDDLAHPDIQSTAGDLVSDGLLRAG